MRIRINDKNLPLLVTLVVCVLLYVVAAVAFYQNNFVSLPVFELLFSSKAPLGIMAVGMTFVILAGGIDLSVGSVMALSTMIVAMLVAKEHAPGPVGIVAALATGAAIGLLNGALIQFFEMPPFLVTLGTLFLARGVALVMNRTNRIALDTQTYPFFDSFTSLRLDLGIVSIYFRSLVLIALVALGVIVTRTTRFGRNIYALGGGEQASILMGLPVARTKILVYAISGLLAALAGVVMLSDSPAGDPTIAVGWELDAIAAVVIGGTLLSGGVGSVAGTLLGVLIISLIEQIITNWGADASRARIINGLLLFAFIALQKFLPALRRIRRRIPAI
jgi:simple sugar transport system permease protein